MSDRSGSDPMSEPIADPHAQVARYFDGELRPDQEAAALRHLATCTRCQHELGDLVGLDTVLAGKAAMAPAASIVTRPAPRAASGRWRRAVPLVGVALAAAAGVLLVGRVGREPAVGKAPAFVEAPALALALAEQRAVEVRFTAEPFARHRPYVVSRSQASHEAVSLQVLADLERRGDRASLLAAHAASGELARARQVLEAMPPAPARDADLAALAVLAGRPEDALAAADRALAAAPTLVAARWNRGLALRELGLALTAAGELDQVAAAGEPGWSDEARARAQSLRAPMLRRAEGLLAFNAAAQAMIDRTGPPLTAEHARQRPGLTRLYFHDALRAAISRDQALALGPLADELDRLAGTNAARRAVDRVAAASFQTRAPLAGAYRELARGRAQPADGAALVARLDRAGPAVADLLLGAIMLTGASQTRLADLTRLAVATGDPWFGLLAVREQARHMRDRGDDDRAETHLRAGLAGCDARAWAHRCGALALDLAQLYGEVARFPEAEEHAVIAVRDFAAAGAPSLEDHALGLLAEYQRGRDRVALAQATFAEVRARAGDVCATARFATIGLALTDIYTSAAPLPVELPGPRDCGVDPAPLELIAFVDRARMSGSPADRARAELWLAAAAEVDDPAVRLTREVARARLDLERDPGAVARLRQLAQAATRDGDDVQRGWIYATMVDDAGRRGAWAEVVTTVAGELGVAAPAQCALAVSVDDTRGTAAVRGPDGAATGAYTEVGTAVAWDDATLVPAALRAALRGCRSVAVFARPPVHGHAGLLPVELPWAFVAGASGRLAAGATAAAPRELVVGDAVPPPALGLPALAPRPASPGAIALRGADATPARVLAELATATYAELHVHGKVDLGIADASFLALSPGADGGWALTAAAVRRARFAAAPVIVLAACRAAEVAPFLHKRWSLPDAFVEAGARAVVAPTVDIPDDQATRFFDELRGRISAGEAPAVALAALRAAYVARDPASWAASVVLFERLPAP